MSRTINIFLTSALISLATTSNLALLSNVYAQDHTTYGPVKSGDLMWSIAGKFTPKDGPVTRQQVIMGILHANPDAFKVPCNFNSLKVGETLNIPALTDIQQVLAEMNSGTPPLDALDHWLKRTPSADLNLVVATFRVQMEVGGNLADKLKLLGQILEKRSAL